MDDVLIKLAPIFAGFAATFALKKYGLVDPKYGILLLKISLYVTIPALILVSISRVGFTQQLFIFPILSGIILLVTLAIMLPLYKRLRLPRITEGTFRIAPLTINSGFVLPFLMAVFGSEGVTRVVMFNAGYNPLLLLGVYSIAAAYNPQNKGHKAVLKRLLILPPFWALIAGSLLNVSDTQLPTFIASSLELIGSLTMILMIAALGLLFNPQRIRFDKTLAVLGLRMGLGLLIGVAIVTMLQLKGIDRAAVLALSAAPIGFNLLTFASVEKLDHEFAASAVSLSLMAALFVTPLILLLAG